MNARRSLLPRLVVAALALLPSCGTQKSEFSEAGIAPPHFISVDGEFNRPGKFAWTNRLTLNDAMALAGGPNGYSLPGWLYVYHWDGSRERFRLDAPGSLTNTSVLGAGDRLIIRRR